MRMLSLLLVLTVTASAAVTPPDQIKVAPGFKVELLREAGSREGSWICMTQDDKGRLYLSPQNAIPESGFAKDSKWGGIWRVTLGKSAQSSVPSAQSGKADTANPKLSTGHWALSTPAEMKWERVPVPVGDAMGMLWAFDSLYVSGMGPQGRGIYRCKSSKGDDQLDTATLFKAIPAGAGEHGAHAIRLGPDKKSLYVINGNSTGILDGLAPDSPYRNWGEDDLLPKLRDPVATFFDKIKAPYGCVYRTDADGTKWELFAGGLRNPYDLAFNPDGELFTYDADMEWDRGLPWYRPTRILHLVPGGEYGFREGSAKWPAWYPDSLPAVGDIGLGCPTGITFGTGAKGWPEKYRRALFLHDWTFGRILAVQLHEKGASYTARNDLASYTYPKDAEANGDVEVFLSGKGMPVTDMEFLPDGSMVFTTGGRGTASGLYRVSYVGAGKNESATQSENPAIVTTKEGSAIANRLGEIFGTPSSVRRQFHDALTYGSNNGMGNPREYARKISEWLSSGSGWLRYATMVGLEIEHQSYRHISPELGPPFLPMTRAGAPEIAIFAALGLSRSDALETQSVTIETLKRFPLATLSDDLKLLKLRVLEVSFARQGRPSAEVVKALVEELSRQYPAKGEPPHGAPPVPAATTPDGKAALPNDATKAGVEKVGAARGSDVAGGDARRSMLNRELSQLLIWLTNPELGELNADLIEKAKASAPGAAPTAPSPAGGKTGDFRPADGAAGQPDGLKAQNSRFSAQKAAFSGAAGDSTTARDDFLGALDRSATARDRSATARDHSATARDHSATARDRSTTTRDHSTTARDRSTTARDRSTTPRDDSTTPRDDSTTPRDDSTTPRDDSTTPRDDSTTPRDDSAAPGNRSATPGHRVSETTGQAFAQAQPLSAKAPADPEKEGTPGGAGAPRTLPASASDRKDGKRATERGFHLGPVPNPGASIFPGRKGAPDDGALAAAGREVIGKTLALMDAAPSQEEQISYALALRWAHGWSPEQRVRYFRWFHEKAARYTGGNSFAKFVEAIRAEAASRVPEPERAALSQWLRPVAAPTPAAALKPRAFVKAWTLPELEAALDALKDRQPDLARGRELYTQAQCAQCHLFRDAGGNVGPDLTAVAQRFGRHDILESITDPSKVVSDQYAMVTLTILDGQGGTKEVSGLIKEETSATITLLTDPLAGKTANIYTNVITKREKAAVSTMPPGLLYTLSAEEVADLLALFGAK